MGTERTWNRADVVATYTHRHHLTPAETRVVAECFGLIANGAVLDVGVGAGRTVPYLAPLAATYLGIDIMPNMLAAAQAAYPEHAFALGDARALPWADGQASFVMFSFCGIDYMPPADRAQVLADVFRVLRPGGAFAMSTHNLAARPAGPSPFVVPRPTLTRDPLRNAVALTRAARAAVRGYVNYRALRAQEQRGPDVAVLNDGAHDYALLTTYVTQAAQRAALEAAGFHVRLVLDPDGRTAAASSTARDLYFVADRPR